jgi:hypothetical protein
MPFNGSGVFSLVAGNPVITGTTISSAWANNTLSDIANNGLTNCLTKDGQQMPTANIPMGGFRLTGLGNGVNRGDSVSLGQLQDNGAEILGSISGTGDVIVAASSPSITAYATGSKFIYTPTLTNTVAAPTINISAVGAKTITQSNGSSLWGGALVVGTPYELYYDGANFRVQSGQLGASIGSGSPYALRNRFIDGGFQLWNASTSVSLTSGQTLYTADMWFASMPNGSATISQGTFAPGTEPAGVTTPCPNYLSFNQTVATTAGLNPLFGQRIESVSTLQGRTATYSIWLWAAAPVTITTVNFTQSFGSGGSTSVTTPATVNWSVTTTPQRFSLAIAIPSIVGKTVGANNFLAILLNLPSGATFTINTTQWQMEDSPVGTPATGLPTPFESRPISLEQSLTNRYFQYLSFPPGSPFAPITVTSTTGAFSEIVVTSLRTTPTVSAGGAGSLRASGNLTWSSSTLSMFGPNVIGISHTITGATVWQTGYSFFNGSVGSISLDARL